jgi:hypothetical protein
MVWRYEVQARTALRALRGIVKLQALVRGQLVRRQANATLRRMQALLAAQAQLRAQRMRVLQEQRHQQPPRRSPQHPGLRRSYVSELAGSHDALPLVRRITVTEQLNFFWGVK